MITAVFSRKGNSIPTVIKQELGKLSEEHTKLLADEHKKELIENIESSRVRIKKPEGPHLADSIDVEKIAESDSKGYGVGNIATINQKTPWMWWINFGRALSGRTSPPVDIGSFAPGEGKPSGGSFRAGLWRHGMADNSLGGIWTLVPNKDIQPHNFIERTLGTMLGRVRQLIGGK